MLLLKQKLKKLSCTVGLEKLKISGVEPPELNYWINDHGGEEPIKIDEKTENIRGPDNSLQLIKSSSFSLSNHKSLKNNLIFINDGNKLTLFATLVFE